MPRNAFDWHEGWAGEAEAFFIAKCASPSAAHALSKRNPPKWMLSQLLKLHATAPGWVRRDEVFELGRLWAVHQLPCEQPVHPESIASVGARCGMRDTAGKRLWSPNRETAVRQISEILEAAKTAEIPVCIARLFGEARSLRLTESRANTESPATRVRKRWERDWLRHASQTAER